MAKRIAGRITLLSDPGEARLAKEAIENSRHRALRHLLEDGIDTLARSSKSRVSPIKRLGRLASGSHSESLYARKAHHPNPKGRTVSIWETPWFEHELPNGQTGMVRLVTGLDTNGFGVEKDLSLHVLLGGGNVESLGVVSTAYDTKGFYPPKTEFGQVDRKIEPSVNGWNLGWPNYFCRPSVVEPFSQFDPEGPEAAYLIEASRDILKSIAV
jgi:hypothetical protein